MQRRHTIMGWSTTLLTVSLSASVSCYTATFDDEASGVFACIEDSECQDGFICWNNSCEDDRGPAITVLGPEPLSVFDSGTAQLEIAIRGEDLTLSNNFDDAVDGEGYLEVLIDGVAVRSQADGTAITEGDLSDGFTIGAVDIPDPTLVNHRIEVRAYRGDGSRYENPSGTGRQIFFVRDPLVLSLGTKPMMAITRPWPGSKLRRGRPVVVELAAVDFTWTNPTGEVSPMDFKEGHAHIFFDRDDYPACLPGCNGLYVDTLRPANSVETGDPRFLRVNDLEHKEDQPAGEFIVSAGLQRNNHAACPSVDPTREDFVLEQAVADNVVVELVD